MSNKEIRTEIRGYERAGEGLTGNLLDNRYKCKEHQMESGWGISSNKHKCRYISFSLHHSHYFNMSVQAKGSSLALHAAN